VARPITAADFVILSDVHYECHARVTIEASPLADVLGTDPLLTYSVTADLNKPVMDLRATFHLGTGPTNLSPWMSTGARLSGRPLLDPGRNIDLEVQTCRPGFAPTLGPTDNTSGWRTLFTGSIDDSDPATSGEQLSIVGRCAMLNTVQKKIDILSTTADGTVFGFTVDAGTVDAAMRQIADKAYGGAYPYVFAVIGTPALGVNAYWQDGQMSLYDALSRIAIQNDGWVLRGRWGVPPYGDDSYVLTYYDPGRFAGARDWVFPANRYFEVRGFPKSRRNVRNRVWVTPADGARVPVMAEDAASQILYGLNPAFISEDLSSHITDSAKASALAAIAVLDLGTPDTDFGLITRLHWPIDINDTVEILGNAVHMDSNLVLAVSGYTHTGTANGDATTTIQTRPLPGAGVRAWRALPKRTYVSLDPPVGGGLEGDTWYPVDDLTPP
jgi:hypothetical protein